MDHVDELLAGPATQGFVARYLEVLLADSRNEARTIVRRHSIANNAVLAEHNLRGGPLSSMELHQVFEQSARTQVLSLSHINEDLLRVYHLFTFFDQGLAHLHQLDTRKVLGTVGHTRWVIAEARNFEELHQVRRLPSA